MNNKIYKKLFVGFGFVSIVLILTLFVMSQTYIQNLVYHERLSQMEEVTHQMFRNLEDVIDTHWDEVDVQCNYLYYTPLKTDTDLYRYLKKLSELSNYHEKQIDLIAVDSAGHYYTTHGRTGLLRGITYLESAPERVSYVSNSLTVDDSRMVFLEQLSTPITLQSGEKEITLRYFGISQSMTQLNDYFRCDAYENNNSVYVLDNNGFKLFNANDTELLKGHNVYTVLSQMSYLHGSSFAGAKERLARTGSCYSNAVLDGTEYFYALKQMENAQWTLAFLVPAEYVAVNTQKLVNIVMAVIVGFATVFSIMAVIAGWFLLREKQQRELQAEKKTNLRLEQYNVQLTQANDEMRRAQDAAAEALQSAERASKAKTDFLSNMSHDIRTPMNAIIGITTLMKNELHEPEKLAEHLGKLESSGQLLLGIINNILDMSRIESGKTTLNVEKMNLPQQISQLDNIIRQQAGQRSQSFTVSTNLQHENVLADPNRLNQVLMNILSNAVKYTPTGGHIRLEVEELPRNEHYARYRFVVQDDGIGMSADYQKTLFDPFTREERSGTNKVQGTGLGMAITKSIVDLMGGTIRVDSTPGRGSRFQVDLTLRIDQSAASPLAGETVLLLSQEEALRDAVRPPLQAADIALLTAADADQAAPLLEREHLQVVLLGGPLDDGTLEAAAARLRKLAPDAAWVLCVDHPQREQAETLAHRGVVDGILPRPFFLTNLEQAVRRTRSAPDGGEEVSHLKGMRFLCAEDNELNAEILRALLELHGASCTIYHDGEEIVRAFQTVRAGAYDAVLMDVQMPRMNGYEATQAIRSGGNPLGKTIPILAMTANAFEEDAQRCFAAGMNAHLAKPLQIDKVKQTILVQTKHDPCADPTPSQKEDVPNDR